MKIVIRPDGSIEIEGSVDEAAAAARKLRNGNGLHKENVAQSPRVRQARSTRKGKRLAPVNRTVQINHGPGPESREHQAYRALVMIRDAGSGGLHSGGFREPLRIQGARDMGALINAMKGLISRAGYQADKVFRSEFGRLPVRGTTYYAMDDIGRAIEAIETRIR